MLGTLRVQTISVDESILRGNAEDTRLGVAFLGERCHTTDFDYRRTQCKQRRRNLSIFIDASRGANRVVQNMTKDLNTQIALLFIFISAFARVEIEIVESRDVADSRMVSLLGIVMDESQCRDDQPLVDAGPGVGDVEVSKAQNEDKRRSIEVCNDL
jgi:hypothetical protein